MEKVLDSNAAVKEITGNLKEFLIRCGDLKGSTEQLKKRLRVEVIAATCKQLDKVYPATQASISTYHLGNLTSSFIDPAYRLKMEVLESSVLREIKAVESMDNYSFDIFMQFLGAFTQLSKVA